MDLNDGAHRRTLEQLRSVLNEVAQEESNQGNFFSRGVKSFRFGVGMLILAVFTVAVGINPLFIDAFNRAMFLVFGLIFAFVGAFFIDRSNRSSNASPGYGDSGALPTATGIRRVK